MGELTITERGRVDAILAERKERRYKSFMDAQVALIESLGYKVGDGVCAVTIHIEADKFPTVTVVRESYDENNLTDGFVKFVECYDLVRKTDTEAA